MGAEAAQAAQTGRTSGDPVRANRVSHGTVSATAARGAAALGSDPLAADATTRTDAAATAAPVGRAANDEAAADAASADTATIQLRNGLSCEVPADSPLGRLLRSRRSWQGPDARARLRLLREAKSVAIVGASANPARASYFVATYLLQSSGYRVWFVNPNASEILGRPVYPDLASLPEAPDIVDVFRRPDDIPSVVEEVLAVGAPTIWVQLGIWNEQAAVDAQARGLTVVMDRCLKIEHARFQGGLHLLGFDTGQITARRGARV